MLVLHIMFWCVVPRSASPWCGLDLKRHLNEFIPLTSWHLACSPVAEWSLLWIGPPDAGSLGLGQQYSKCGYSWATVNLIYSWFKLKANPELKRCVFESFWIEMTSRCFRQHCPAPFQLARVTPCSGFVCWAPNAPSTGMERWLQPAEAHWNLSGTGAWWNGEAASEQCWRCDAVRCGKRMK